MIKSVTIKNWLNEEVKITLSDGNPEHGMIITDIEGLGPPKANVNMTDLANMDGSIFNSARVEKRNIIIHMLFDFAPTIEDTRQRTYKYFPVKKEVELLIETDNRVLKITGVVESNEPEIFSENESNVISILCDNPYFHSDKDNTTFISEIDPLFEFEFSNESLTEPLIEFSSYNDGLENSIYYEGDADVGVTITLHCVGNVGDITIYNANTREYMRISADIIKELVGSGIISGDDILITTVKGNKTIGILRYGKYTNVLNALDKESDWFQLAKGRNIFAFDASFGSENIRMYVQNQILYEGV